MKVTVYEDTDRDTDANLLEHMPELQEDYYHETFSWSFNLTPDEAAKLKRMLAVLVGYGLGGNTTTTIEEDYED